MSYAEIYDDYADKYGDSNADGDWSQWADESSTNGSESSWGDFGEDIIPDHIRIMGTVFGSTISTIGLFGNLLLCASVLVNKTLRTPGNSFIVSLAVADIVKLAVFTPLIIHTFRVGEWQFGGVGCLLQVIDYGLISLTVCLHVVIITFYRYLIIVWPNYYPKLSSRKALATAFFLLYLIPVTVAVRSLVTRIMNGYTMWVDVFFINSALACVFAGDGGSILDIIFVILGMFGVILYLYGHIWIVVRRSARALQNFDGRKTLKKANKEKPIKEKQSKVC